MANVRIGRLVEFQCAVGIVEAQELIEKMSDALLVNPLIESYEFEHE